MMMRITHISEDQKQIRKQIKDTARVLFSTKGYDVIELGDIASALNVPEDVVEALFLSKDQLLEEVWSE